MSPIAKAVVALIDNTKSAPITIDVHGDWGAGKSSVLAMVEAAMKGRQKILCLRFNGWTFQGFEDAKVAMLQSIVAEIRDARPTDVKLQEKAVTLFKRINWLKVAKRAAGSGLTVATGLPSIDQVSGLAGVAKAILSKGAITFSQRAHAARPGRAVVPQRGARPARAAARGACVRQAGAGHGAAHAQRKGVALLLLSMFTGVPTDLQLTLKGLDSIRAALVVGLVADFVNSRFDFTDEELVREHFSLDP